MQRTTIVLDGPSRRAARALARHWGCSASEAIRRAVVRQREELSGVSPQVRAQRRRALERLFKLFHDVDAAAEVARIKAEDAGF